MDANDHIYKGTIGKELTDNSGLAMKEVMLNTTGEELGATYFRGSTPINGIWATNDIGIANACVMPVGYGIVDLIPATLTGNNPPKKQRPAARQLNTRLMQVADRYIEFYEENARQPRLMNGLEMPIQIVRIKPRYNKEFIQLTRKSDN